MDEKKRLPVWRTKLLETALLLDGGMLAVVGMVGWLLGWEGWRPFGTALIWVGTGTLVIGLLSALFVPGPEESGRRRLRPRIPPLGDSIMWLLLVSGIVAIALGLTLRRF
jgi:hypothetical protein